MSRRTLTNEQWERIEGHLPGRAGTRERSGVDNRLFVDAVLWMACNAARWRDLPEVFGKWSGVHAPFRRWSHADVWERLFHAMADTPDFEYVRVDSTISIAKLCWCTDGSRHYVKCREPDGEVRRSWSWPHLGHPESVTGF